MKKLAYFVQIYVIVAFVCVMSALAQTDPSDSDYHFWRDTVSRTENLVRDAAVNQPVPVYPVSAVESNIQGDVTAYVIFDAAGKLIWTKILKSPSQEISDEVINAVKKWEVKPFRFNYEFRKVISRLRFVFTIKDGIPTVSAPPLEIQRSTCVECNDFNIKLLKREKAKKQ